MLQLLPIRLSSAVRRSVLVASCTIGLSLAAQAQQAPRTIHLSPEDQQRGLNGVQKNFFFTTGDGSTEAEYKNAGFFGQRLRPYLAGNEEALDNLNRYRRQKWMYLTERLVFVGAVGMYSQQVFSLDDRQQYFNNNQKVAAGIALASLLSNVFISRNTNSHMQRAVEANNAGLPAARTGALQLRPSSVGLTASNTGRPLLAFTWNLR
ncbi:hypothetical protein DNI29_03520 [Hymenobacter sediminis]|uniref:hypothetical protein n=1 Tax=Hymenobacter sediminis TaxID=2218621 RepID=UPI000F5165CC|nr:hypothetical protein [Hymenobacter sediminis]RPD49879.1 hypothetical protein DNI29_03520 [Hymenobacter sediminis]